VLPALAVGVHRVLPFLARAASISSIRFITIPATIGPGFLSISSAMASRRSAYGIGSLNATTFVGPLVTLSAML
jgi:hypothetical protein